MISPYHCYMLEKRVSFPGFKAMKYNVFSLICLGMLSAPQYSLLSSHTWSCFHPYFLFILKLKKKSLSFLTVVIEFLSAFAPYFSYPRRGLQLFFIPHCSLFFSAHFFWGTSFDLLLTTYSTIQKHIKSPKHHVVWPLFVWCMFSES